MKEVDFLSLRCYTEDYFHCPFCGRAFNKDSIMSNHSIINEEGIVPEKYMCSCGAVKYSMMDDVEEEFLGRFSKEELIEKSKQLDEFDKYVDWTLEESDESLNRRCNI